VVVGVVDGLKVGRVAVGSVPILTSERAKRVDERNARPQGIQRVRRGCTLGSVDSRAEKRSVDFYPKDGVVLNPLNNLIPGSVEVFC
jgi:hypothetical protein